MAQMLDLNGVTENLPSPDPQPGGASQTAPGFDLSPPPDGGAGLATGAVAGGLAALLLGNGKRRKVAQKALDYGGMALVGRLACKAWNDWQAARTEDGRVEGPAPVADEETFVPSAPAARENLARVLVRAMITAAKADGHITGEERARLQRQLGALRLSAGEEAFVCDEIEAPMDVNAVVAGATTREYAAEIYTASVLVIDADGAAERGYLALLAARLGLPADLVANLHARVDVTPAMADA